MKEQLCPTCIERGDGKCSFEEALGQLVEEIIPIRGKRVTKKVKIDAGKSLISYLGEALEQDCPNVKTLKLILESRQGQKPQAGTK